MRKLKLDLNDLAVESFSSGAVPETPGTVKGHSGYFHCTQDFNCVGDTQFGACDTLVLGCYTTVHTNQYQCTAEGQTCVDTCFAPCGFSDATNCHYCPSDRYCPTDPNSC